MRSPVVNEKQLSLSMVTELLEMNQHISYCGWLRCLLEYTGKHLYIHIHFIEVHGF